MGEFAKAVVGTTIFGDKEERQEVFDFFGSKVGKPMKNYVLGGITLTTLIGSVYGIGVAESNLDSILSDSTYYETDSNHIVSAINYGLAGTGAGILASPITATVGLGKGLYNIKRELDNDYI